MAKVFVFAPSGDTRGLLEGGGCEVVLGKAGWHTPQGNNEPEMVAMAAEADALTGTSIRSSPISRNIMLASRNLRIVAKSTVGVDDIDVEAATELGILITHAPTESNWGAVAEGTVAIVLALLKRVRERDAQVKGGGWRDETLQGTYLGRRLSDGYPGITLGIIGLGRIGGRVSQLFRPWNMRVIASDPYIPDYRFLEFGVEPVDLDTLLRESDVVSMHVVLNKETRHMMAAEQFSLMKPSAIFVNTSRGGAVDEASLARALEEGTIRAAGMDVFEDEPISRGSPLRRLGDKVLLSPHMVSANQGGGLGGLGHGSVWAAEAVLRALAGELPEHVFNADVIPLWLERFGGKSVLRR
ncbi:MAG TPA: NAD(P)-dependent oxidoreductase [Dehalococcoidia bacterium]|nr:NAD(P)-dependent oxidoreductase [Dehalococcoidia bacterium]